ncbi:MAG: MFS transporter [Pseudonocardiaceae bacterium]|nr:MFS transporter [Pseudonocardiaceae bacterium]
MDTASATRAPGAMLLGVGIVALEFAAAVTTIITTTLLPTVARDLHARDQLGLLVAGSTLGLFVALPLASRMVRRLGARGTLTFGLCAYFSGAAVAVTSHTAWVFAVGQFVEGLASGLLAVFGISSAIRHLDEALRVRVIAASSAMWIVPALVGPPSALALQHVFGWRWTLLVPVPIVVVGRLLIVRAARPGNDEGGPARQRWRTLLVPIGVGALVLGSETMGSETMASWPAAAAATAGIAVAFIGLAAIMPAGTIRLRRGTPAALGAMLLFATGYFGANSLITILLTDGYRTSGGHAAIVLSASPLAWALTSLLVSRLWTKGRKPPPAAGLALAASGTAVLTATLFVSTSFGAALVGWTATGVGVGLAYPSLYILATNADITRFTAPELATAVITAEAFGSLLGRATGGAITSLGAAADLARTTALIAAYTVFVLFLFAAALAATRSVKRRD